MTTIALAASAATTAPASHPLGSSTFAVDGLPASGEVVLCVENDDVCTIVVDAVARAGEDEVTLTAAVPAGTLQMLTAPSCSL